MNDLFASKQYGFRSNHSCETALIAMTDNWLNSIYNNEYCGVLFIDLCEAFDFVNKNILLEKLQLHNLDNNSLIWFQSYLTDRKQSVKINANSSDELTTKFMVFKAANNKTPSYTTNMFQSACRNTQHSLRSKTNNKLQIPKAHQKRLR